MGDSSGLDPRHMAAIDLLNRTGAQAIRIGVTPDEDGVPAVWHATAAYRLDPDGIPVPKGGRLTHEVAAGLTPLAAVLRLCERVIDGGACVHCRRPSIFLPDADDAGPLNKMGCVYQFDPELSTFRRNCEGDT